jgi:hypothetical protein
VDFLRTSQRCQRNGGKSNCDLVQINHGVSFSGSKAAMLRVNKTYAKGGEHQKSVPAIVPQGFALYRSNTWLKAPISQWMA